MGHVLPHDGLLREYKVINVEKVPLTGDRLLHCAGPFQWVFGVHVSTAVRIRSIEDE